MSERLIRAGLALGVGVIFAACVLPQSSAAEKRGLRSRSERAFRTGPRLGTPAQPAEMAVRDTLVAPDGEGLPLGRGSAIEGERVYTSRCLRCHGLKGAGQPADRLVGGIGSLKDLRAIKTVGSYWPYATTLFDYVRRAMPYDRPGSLSSDEVYAVVAYLLSENGIIDSEMPLDAKALVAVRMPNRDGFVPAPEAVLPRVVRD